MPLPLLPLAYVGATAAWKAIHSQAAQRIAHRVTHQVSVTVHSQAAHRIVHQANRAIHSQAAQTLAQTTQSVASTLGQRTVDMARDKALEVTVDAIKNRLK